MAAALAGVPMISMDLTDLPDEQISVIRTMLHLYREYRDFWKRGAWRVSYDLGNAALLTAEWNGICIQFINTPCAPVSDAAELVFNLSARELPCGNRAGFDACGNRTDGNIPPGGFGIKAVRPIEAVLPKEKDIRNFHNPGGKNA